MKRILTTLLAMAVAASAFAQPIDALKELSQDPRKAYGTDYPYGFEMKALTPSPKGYKPFYISHYARHGSRYYWNESLYVNLDAQITEAHEKGCLTKEAEAFYAVFKEMLPELMTGNSELTELGWQQHQAIARTMYNRFPEVFKKGGHVSAISSLAGRCVLSMSGFCQELVQCNPALEIREQSSRFTLHAVVPTDAQNPYRKEYPKVTPRYTKSSVKIPSQVDITGQAMAKVFKSTEGLSFEPRSLVGNIRSLYTSLPSIDKEGLLDYYFNDADIAANWESSNLGSYSWVFGSQWEMVPILEDILKCAKDVIEGRSSDVASLRFGHDSCLGPLTVLLGINGADRDPEDPYEVKNCYQSWQTCMAGNIQLIFYKGKKAGDEVLVKCLMNGSEATLPLPTTNAPYYKWSDFYNYFSAKCK